MDNNINNGVFENGSVNISENVISIIASIAAEEIDGISKSSGGFTGEISEMLGMKKPSKGIDVYLENDIINVSMSLGIRYGLNIEETSLEVQKNVKENIESMTGLKVDKVNIHIQEINFEDTKDSNLDNIETHNYPL